MFDISGSRWLVRSVCIAILAVCSHGFAQDPAPLSKASPGQFEIRSTDIGVEVRENGQRVLFYQRAPKRIEGKKPAQRAHYVHPLYDLNGNVITEDFPDDHVHHRGVFWAWHQTIVGNKNVGDAWVCQNFDWDVKSVTTEINEAAIIRASAVWLSPDFVDEDGTKQPIAKDEVEIKVYPRHEHYRAVDFTIRITAIQPAVKIGGSDDEKGYGGFSARIQMSKDLTFVSSNGTVKPTKLALKADRWMKFQSGKFSYAILNAADNPGDPTQWIIRQKRSMQNPVYPGRKPVELKTNQAMVLRHRVLILKGDADSTEYDLPAMLGEYDAIQSRQK